MHNSTNKEITLVDDVLEQMHYTEFFQFVIQLHNIYVSTI